MGGEVGKEEQEEGAHRVFFKHTPPVSPSSYSVKPSICRYPWKRSLLTHEDRLASSYSAGGKRQGGFEVRSTEEKINQSIAGDGEIDVLIESEGVEQLKQLLLLLHAFGRKEI